MPSMKKKNHTPEAIADDMRAHYDFDYSKSRPNRFAVITKVGWIRVAVPTQHIEPLRNGSVRKTTAAIRNRR
jgi:hypothetical protein